jgi:hypothetical protein
MGATISILYWLMDEGMLRLKPFFQRYYGKRRVDDRFDLSGAIFLNSTGLRRYDARQEHGHPNTSNNR